MRLEEVGAKALKILGDDRYKLAIMVAKRANQLTNGARPLCELPEKNMKPTDIALIEIAEGKISFNGFANLK